MTIFFAIVAVLAIAFTMFVLVKNKKLEVDLFRVQKEAQASIADSQSSANQLVTVAQQEAQASIAEAQVSADRRVTVAQQEAQVSVAEAQKLIDQQMTAIQQEGERIRQYYEAESRNVQEAANAVLAKTIKEFEPLRKYETLREAEAEAQRQLADALEAARSLRAEAQNLLAQTKDAAADQRLAAEEKVKDIHEQADARLNQAIRDAGSIITRAERGRSKSAGMPTVRCRKRTNSQRLPRPSAIKLKVTEIATLFQRTAFSTTSQTNLATMQQARPSSLRARCPRAWLSMVKPQLATTLRQIDGKRRFSL